MAQSAEINDRYIDLLLEKSLTTNGDIELKHLSGKFLPEGIEVLLKYSGNKGLSRDQARDILTHPEATGRRFPTPSGIVFTTQRGILTKSEIMPITDQLPFDIKIIDKSGFKPDRSGNTAYFSTSLLDEGELSWRTWRNGDRMQPFGMKGTRLLSDIFTDLHIPAHLRLNIPLLLDSKGNILFAAGVRASALYPVLPNDQQLVKVSISSLENNF